MSGTLTGDQSPEIGAGPFAAADATLSPYLLVADAQLGLLSVFDDLKYDRADADILTPAMRAHAVKVLGGHGFRQTSGRMLRHPSGIRCHIPRFRALGASPFDILRETDRADGDFVLLTPTQTACQFVDHYDHETAVARVKALITTQPINLFRLMDYLEAKPAHEAFRNAIGHLKFVQREAVAAPGLRSKRALG